MHICGLSNSFLMHYYHRCRDTSGTITLERPISRIAEVGDRFDHRGRRFPRARSFHVGFYHHSTRGERPRNLSPPKPLKIVTVPAVARTTADRLTDGGIRLTRPFSSRTSAEQMPPNTEQAERRCPPSVSAHHRRERGA